MNFAIPRVNVIIWPSLLARQRKQALSASLLAAYGVWECLGDFC
ncbi:hypothetical protein J2778_006219 [Paraburkholderia graminis]|nr:hypothetical protein [Paraburkholderia graminis]